MTALGAAAPAAAPAPQRASVPRDALPWLAVAAAFTHALAVSWRKWGDLSVDTGRELDLPRRLAEGQLLYRDARFYYGPLAPYVNALLYRIFGVHLDVLVWAGIASAALTVVALYRLSRNFLPRWASTAIAVVFVYLCAFAHLYVGAIFNFVLPYTYAATYGIVAATWSLVFLIDHVRSGRTSSFLLSAGCLALAALSKMEALAPAAAAHALFLASLGWTRPRGRTLCVYAAGYAGAAALALGVYGFFWLSVGPTLWTENLFGLVNPGSEKFVLAVMGVLGWKASLQAVGLSALLIAGTLAVGYGLSLALARREVAAAAGWLAVAVAGLAAFACWRFWQLHVHFRALPLVMAIAVVTLGVLYGRQRDRRAEWLVHLLLWVFGFAALWRIVLNAKPHHYGFYLLPVGLVCLGVLLFSYAPATAGGGPWAARVFGVVGVGALAASVSLAIADSKQLYALHTYEIATARGRLKILNRWQLEGPAVEALAKMPRDTRLLTIPQGPGLLYFSGLREADTMFSYLPMEVVDAQADNDLLSRLRSTPPDVVAWVGIPMEEFGSGGFGFDYAGRSMAWIRENYISVTEPSAAIVFMVRKNKVGRLPVPDLRPTPQSTESQRTVTGRVIDYYKADGVTFVRLATGGEKLWAAVPETDLSIGSSITIYGVRRGAAEQGGLRRRFETVLAGRLAPNGRAAR